MKRLIMCEGPNELEIIRILVENDRLVFGEDDLLGLTPYHARQIASSAQVRMALNIYPGNDVLVMRVGDKQSDDLTIPEDYAGKIIGIEKYCTKPELEMLLILGEGLLKEFEKVKSSISPKAFAKMYIKKGRRRYDNSTAFYHDYFSDNPDLLVSVIREYKQKRPSHKKGELYLADILK